MIVLKHYLHEKARVTFLLQWKGLGKWNIWIEMVCFLKIPEMAVSNNSSVIRTFDTGARSELCWSCSERCPRLLDQQTVAKPRVPCRLLITSFFIFNHKVHVFYCSWSDFAAHLSRPGSVSLSHQPSCADWPGLTLLYFLLFWLPPEFWWVIQEFGSRPRYSKHTEPFHSIF